MNSWTRESTAADVTGAIDLTGRTALITGCNAGIGRETMRVLVGRGAHVIGTGRNADRITSACEQVTAAGGAGGVAIPLVCDQTDFASVVACADAVRTIGEPLDILVCNAGVYGVRTLELIEGIEMNFAVNHLSHFILVNRLLDLVAASSQGRVVIVGSGDTGFAGADRGSEFADVAGQESYDWIRSYVQSKLANRLYAVALADRLADTPATANALNPGLVKTVRAISHFRENHDIDLEEVAHAKTVEQGAATTCYLATAPELTEVSGAFFSDCAVIPPQDAVRDAEVATRLWRLSERLVGKYLE